MLMKVNRRPPISLPRGWAQQLRGLSLVPLLLLLVIVVLDLSTSRTLEFNRFLAVVPALAAALLPAAATVGVGLLSLAGAAALAARFDYLDTSSAWITMGVITAVTLAGAYASQVRRRRERSLAEVRAVAEVAQRVLLRPVPHRLGQVDLEAIYQAAAARAKIGGDFYEALDTRCGVRLMIGDVRGKGLEAVEIASVMLGSFREAAHDAPDLPDLARRLETSMGRWGRGDDMLECFVTLLLVEIPADAPIARLVNCGHPAPLLLHGEEVFELEPPTPSPPMNMAELLGDEYYVETIRFPGGDRLLLYTDGIIETRDSAGAFYPLNQRVGRWASVPLHTLLDRLYQDLIAHASGILNDDLAAVIAHRSGRQSTSAKTGAAQPQARDPHDVGSAVRRLDLKPRTGAEPPTILPPGTRCANSQRVSGPTATPQDMPRPFALSTPSASGVRSSSQTVLPRPLLARCPSGGHREDDKQAVPALRRIVGKGQPHWQGESGIAVANLDTDTFRVAAHMECRYHCHRAAARR